jgi:hypothetical protein
MNIFGKISVLKITHTIRENGGVGELTNCGLNRYIVMTHKKRAGYRI